MKKETVYMVCDYTDKRASKIDACPHIGVEHMGCCSGRILRENGTQIGRHSSSSFGWLRADLKSKLDDPKKYEIVDLIGKPVPEKFKEATNLGRGCLDGDPCIPGLRQQRDQLEAENARLRKERDELDNAFQNEWEKRTKIEKELNNRLTVSFVGRIPKKYDHEGYAGVFIEKENHIYINLDEPISTLVHEIGHYVIAQCGGNTKEHDLYDYLDCEGHDFIDFANRVETLEAENDWFRKERDELIKKECLTLLQKDLATERRLKNEARRMYCEEVAPGKDLYDYELAREFKWDCYDKE